MMPPALKLPVRVEESLALVPTMILAEDKVVAIVGLAFWTVSGSHAELAPLLLASPE